MPAISEETLESVQATEQVVKEFISRIRGSEPESDPLSQYWFFQKLQKSLNLDSHGRLSGFAQYVIYFRRKSIEKLFKGDNQEQIAKTLQAPLHIVRGDIELLYETKSKK